MMWRLRRWPSGTSGSTLPAAAARRWIAASTSSSVGAGRRTARARSDSCARCSAPPRQMKFSRWSHGVLPKNLSRLLLSGLGSLAAPSGRAISSAQPAWAGRARNFRLKNSRPTRRASGSAMATQPRAPRISIKRAQIVNIFRHDRPAEHRDLERARHIEQGEIERLQQQERPDPARHREHQQRQQQIEPEIIGYARFDDLDPERRPAREIGDGVEHGGRNDRHRPSPAGQNPPVLHLFHCHESGFPQPRSR